MIEINNLLGLFFSYKPWPVLVFAVLVWIAPLHFAVKFVGGDTYILKSLGYAILSAFWHLFSVLLLSFAKVGEYGLIIGFIGASWFYSRKFDVGLFRGGLILILQYVFGIIVSFIIEFMGIISVKDALINIGVKI